MRHWRIVRNVRLGVRNLMVHALRSALTVLGMVFGVGSVIAMLAVGEGASREALEQIRKLGSNNIIISAQKPLEDQAAGAERVRMSIYGLRYADELRIAETVPMVRRTVPVKVVRKEGFAGDRRLELRIVGTTADWFDLVRREVLAGRVLTGYDMEGPANVCVLTEHGALRLLATEHTVGRSIRLGQDYFTVVGIVRSESTTGDIQTPDQNVDAYIPLGAARERYGDITVQRTAGSRVREMVELHKILVEVRSTGEVEQAAKAVTRMLERFHPRKDYRVEVPKALLRQAEATKRTFNIVLGSIAAISLLVGGIGIMNIMLATVTERTREIGIRRAIGAKRRQIVGQFLIETTVLSTIGGLVGIVAGVTLAKIVTVASDMPTEVSTWSILLSLGISMSVGMIFGLYPAVRAAKLDPIVALRHE